MVADFPVQEKAAKQEMPEKDEENWIAELLREIKRLKEREEQWKILHDKALLFEFLSEEGKALYRKLRSELMEVKDDV